MHIQAKNINYFQITQETEYILESFGCKSCVPVDIESIVEFNYNLEIVPFPNLRNDMNVDGILTNDAKSIYVDEKVFNVYGNRYRFTLAHELGHLILHSDVYDQFKNKFESVQDWLNFLNSIPPNEYAKFEQQSNNFAGLILVPRETLIKEYCDSVQKIKKKGYSISNTTEKFIVEDLSGKFNVSFSVVQARIYLEKKFRKHEWHEKTSQT